MIEWLKHLLRRRQLYQIYDGPLDDRWTTKTVVPHYKFVQDVYSGRWYHVYKGDTE